MGTLSREAYRKVVVLGTIASFGNGVYGSMRLQKIVYLGTRTAPAKPFPYIRYHYGQYSQELEDTKDQLLSMGLICVEPMQTKHGIRIGEKFIPTGSGNIFKLAHNADRFRELLGNADPQLEAAIAEAVRSYGYLPEEKLIELAYSLPEFQAKAVNETILDADVPERVQVNLNEEECDELELSLSPPFVHGASLILSGLEGTQIDFSKLKTVSKLN